MRKRHGERAQVSGQVRSSRNKVQAHHRRLRAQGLRPVQIWVPDTRAAKFATEAHKQSRRVAASARAAEDQSFVDAISEELGE
jgi:hypothetical protein